MVATFLQQHRAAALAVAAAVLLTACGGSGAGDPLAGSPAPSPPAPAAEPDAAAATPLPFAPSRAPSTPGSRGPTPAAAGVPAGQGLDPARIAIPAIGVDARVTDLGLTPDGSMDVPDDFSVTGWFRHGPRPGQQGPAVIAGHVDSTSGPAVFYRLGELRPGHRVDVAAPDGDAVTFEVRRVEQHPKEAFPTQAVYAFTEEPTLRLVTCGGPFNETIGHYEHNVIVFAERVA